MTILLRRGIVLLFALGMCELRGQGFCGYAYAIGYGRDTYRKDLRVKLNRDKIVTDVKYRTFGQK
jgi:hypothetical protein